MNKTKHVHQTIKIANKSYSFVTYDYTIAAFSNQAYVKKILYQQQLAVTNSYKLDYC